MGLIYGLLLYKKNEKSNIKFIIYLIISSILVLGVVDILITPIWINILYKKAYFVIISARYIQKLIMLPVQVIIIFFIVKAIQPFAKKYLYEEIEK